MSYIGDILGGIKTLLTGMKVTGGYFFPSIINKKYIITRQYPDEPAIVMDRFKGEVVMWHNENNEHRCTGCQACEIACPNGSIEIIWDRVLNEETGKKVKVIDKHIYHLSMCTMCNLCIQACPTNAIMWSTNFHNSTYDRLQLTKVLNKPGSKLMAGVEE
ncbi:MAG TPA: 4Fe-4S dicluster domain-containing protein [Flavobacteriales bacterium]|jgi:NADH-quinone oxidoreductase subunit I|nr:4Fe-4S dicluster domain-containing protein [Flavobacteriales bacterium]